ncbi:MAG TPA: MATE family efflux transporter, partial [Paludibacter sp.]|nr:MATE family efflux transporter [Paludibacter sp.]
MKSNTDFTNKLATESIGKLIWQYSIPAITGAVVMSLYNIVDRIFIGQGVGALAISGLALTFPF